MYDAYPISSGWRSRSQRQLPKYSWICAVQPLSDKSVNAGGYPSARLVKARPESRYADVVIYRSTITGFAVRAVAQLLVPLGAAAFAVYEPTEYTLVLVLALIGAVALAITRPPPVRDSALRLDSSARVLPDGAIHRHKGRRAASRGRGSHARRASSYPARGRVVIPAGVELLLCFFVVTAVADPATPTLRKLAFPALAVLACYVTSANANRAHVFRFLVYLALLEVGVAVLQTHGLALPWQHLEPGFGTSVYANQILGGHLRTPGTLGHPLLLAYLLLIALGILARGKDLSRSDPAAWVRACAHLRVRASRQS